MPLAEVKAELEFLQFKHTYQEISWIHDSKYNYTMHQGKTIAISIFHLL